MYTPRLEIENKAHAHIYQKCGVRREEASVQSNPAMQGVVCEGLLGDSVGETGKTERWVGVAEVGMSEGCSVGFGGWGWWWLWL